MADYLEPANLDEKDMSPDYREAEQAYREQAAKLWTEAAELKKRVRRNVDVEPEERQDEYLAAYQSLNTRFEKLANDFSRRVETQRRSDTHLLQEGVGERFADHVISLSARPVEELEQIMQTARRTGERDLARACGQVALDKQRYQLFEEWASSEPELADAMRRLRTIPSVDQLRVRTLAMRPPRAAADTLEPTAADYEHAQSSKASAEAARAAFFNLPRRQVGSRIAC